MRADEALLPPRRGRGGGMPRRAWGAAQRQAPSHHVVNGCRLEEVSGPGVPNGVCGAPSATSLPRVRIEGLAVQIPSAPLQWPISNTEPAPDSARRRPAPVRRRDRRALQRRDSALGRSRIHNSPARHRLTGGPRDSDPPTIAGRERGYRAVFAARSRESRVRPADGGQNHAWNDFGRSPAG